MTLCNMLRVIILFGAIVLVASQAYGRILVLHSYHETYDWVQGINEGLLSYLKAGEDLRFYYMDTKRRPDEAWKRESAQKAKDKIAAYNPQVVIAIDDNAQKYVVSEYAGHSDIQFVFCGVNENPKVYGYPHNNVTGILERAYPQQVLQMLQKIDPKVKKVAWVSDDSPTGHGPLLRMRKLVEKNALPVEMVDFVQPHTFAQWRQTITAFNKRPDIHALLIPLYHTVKSQKTGISMLPAEIMHWTVKNTNKPVVGFWPFSTDDGALCAVAVDPFEHGKVAALMAKQILGGKKTFEIPIVTNKDGYVIVNLKSAYELGIDVPFEVIQSADRIIE